MQAAADVQSWACALTVALTDCYRSDPWLCGIGIKRRSFEIIGGRQDVFQDYFNKFFLVIEADNCYVTTMLNKPVTFFSPWFSEKENKWLPYFDQLDIKLFDKKTL